VLRNQLVAAAAVPAAIGAVVGAFGLSWFILVNSSGSAFVPVSVLAGVSAVVLSASVAALGAVVASRLLRRPLDQAMSVQSLRTA
jgi:drug/metabolite transporter (DMT)-like permease